MRSTVTTTATSLLLGLLFHGASARIANLVLVNTATGEDIMIMTNQMVIDTSITGEKLTIRADTTTPTTTTGTAECVLFDLDHGTLMRTIPTEPFVLAGKSVTTDPNGSVTLYPSAALRTVGSHTVTARACPTNDDNNSNNNNNNNAMILVVGSSYDIPGRGTPPITTTTTTDGGGSVGGEDMNVVPPPLSVQPQFDPTVLEPVPMVDTTNTDRTLVVAPTTTTTTTTTTTPTEDVITIEFEVTAGSGSAIVIDDNKATNSSSSSVNSTSSVPSDVPPYYADVFGAVSGELKQWHKITLGFAGPIASETGMTIPGQYRPPSTFADYRLDCLFTHTDTNTQLYVPGYYAGNGNAANGAVSGNVWVCHIRPNQVGTWTWVVEYAEGTNVAQNGGGNPAGFFNGVSGSFDVAESDKTGSDLRSKGRLQYVGKHHFQFSGTGEYLMKAGPDSPSNILAYEEFDGTPNYGGYRKTYASHEIDFREGNPTFAAGQGKALIGAINYLAAKGMNVISVTTLDSNGDDKNVFPFISFQQNDRLDYDISKLAQWEVVFDHAEQMGIALHIKLQDGDSDEVLGSASLSEERKLYFREMIARFGHHLAVTWDLGKDVTNTEYITERSTFIKRLDPYQNPIVVHANHAELNSILTPLLSLATIDGISLQSDPIHAAVDTFTWRTKSNDAGRPWVVTVDQQDDTATGVLPDGIGNNHDSIRQNVLWGNILAGGAGVQYYFGLSFADSDLTLQDFRSRDSIWTQSSYALRFFSDNKVPFWDMSNVDSNREYLIDSTADTIVYHVTGTSNQNALLNVPGTSAVTYNVQWFDPRNGGALTLGTVPTVHGGTGQSIGVPPSLPMEDWVVLLRRTV